VVGDGDKREAALAGGLDDLTRGLREVGAGREDGVDVEVRTEGAQTQDRFPLIPSW